MKRTIKHYYLLLVSLAMTLASCDQHRDFPETGIRPGQVLCEDGHIRTLDAMRTSGQKAVAIVFYANNNPDIEGLGYAVFLHELAPYALSDSLGITQGTSCNAAALDGNANTHALYNTKDCSSPAADKVFDMWACGQSAYIPSVAQMRLLYDNRAIVNKSIKACGGDILPVDTDTYNCWYWTSTEVDGMQDSKAWLYSLESGARQETPKIQEHAIRPIITLNE